jgi:glucokinase
MTPRTRYLVGVDLGGTNIVAGALAEDGREVLAMRSEPTRSHQGADAVIERIVRMIDTVIAETVAQTGASRADFGGIGVGAPGPLDRKRGVVVTTPNLGWVDFPLRDVIGTATRLPVRIDNDANCATLGEWWQGAGRGVRSLAGITLGTGIGGGLILDGRLVHGASGTAGELGHTTIDLNGRRCGCGNYGCLEAYASGPNIAARAREGIEAGYASAIVDLVEGDLDRVTALTVYDALLLGDRHAHEVMLETAKVLGAGIANIVNTFNPEMVVIVGGVTRAGEHLFGPLRAEVRRRAFEVAVEACQIVPGELEAAGVIGAAGIYVHRNGGTLDRVEAGRPA